MINEGEECKVDKENKFKMSIDKISMRFINPNYEEEFLNYKYEKKNLLIAIGICIYFNTLLYTLRIIQNFFSAFFDRLLSGNLLAYFIIYASISLFVLFFEMAIFFIKKLQILRGFPLIICSMYSAISGSFNYSSSFNIPLPMYTIITGYIISTNIICSFLYAWNWICGSIQILIIIGFVDYYVIIFPWSWINDKSFLILISLSTGLSLILSIFYIEYFQRKSIFMRIEADNQAKNVTKIVEKLPTPVIIVKNSQVISVNEEFKHIQIEPNFVEDSGQVRNLDKQRSQLNPEMEASSKINSILTKLIKKNDNKSFQNVIEESKLLKDEEFNIFHENNIKQYFEVTSINLVEERGNQEILYLMKNLNNFNKIKDLQNIENQLRIYFSSVSHDVRTLINIVQGKSEMIDSVEIDPTKKKLLKGIMNASSMLNLMIQEVLDFSQLRNGSLRIIPVNFSIKDEFISILELFEDKYKSKRLYLVIDISPSVPEVMRNDINKIKQILLNLISNAYKFTLIGGVKIKVSKENNNLIKVEVIDTGMGFDMAEKSKLFHEFGRLSMHSSVNPNGVGLGLFICKQMAEKLGGTIDAYSELNRGTTFMFWFKNYLEDNNLLNNEISPVNQEEIEFEIESNLRLTSSRKLYPLSPYQLNMESTKNPSFQDKTAKTERPCNCSKLLIVEDDPDIRIILKNFCERCNIKFEEAQDGEIALQHVQEKLNTNCCKTFKLILTDYLMPKMDGVQSSIEIKKMLRHIPGANTNIILVSALEENQQKKIIQMEDNPFTDIVPKPLKFAKFKLIVNTFISNE